ncbi:uncharacterized protein BO80DRAFT_440257 [Aspergillus ibericus CBS 121593]|uniref:F-box domain-containing protein n=1 Tax=Aspergillus ibericus CBS 121593 TaxID=1448316 RepID=A0A395HGW2_9EURO|nr:hypothetical protein BO80DRAFT_440257 [Aspergillus ibericus CBS 121593]RAL06385.1 hypothetical protein BO80DRAFT_440257 [Aspergillus ibericus CBS 121593]
MARTATTADPRAQGPSTPPSPSAMQRVLAIPELLEALLLAVGSYTLAAAKLVCRLWRDLIELSPPLRKKYPPKPAPYIGRLRGHPRRGLPPLPPLPQGLPRPSLSQQEQLHPGQPQPSWFRSRRNAFSPSKWAQKSLERFRRLIPLRRKSKPSALPPTTLENPNHPATKELMEILKLNDRDSRLEVAPWEAYDVNSPVDHHHYDGDDEAVSEDGFNEEVVDEEVLYGVNAF